MKILNWFKTNAAKGILSTILGTGVIIGSVASVFLTGTSWTDAAIGIGAGVGLIGLLRK
ncbi:hypothetical protein [Leptospira johnsonii]|uniref:Uncharacterized protein n=1 Tax=Leptospira johnsonii TaxID=1917820 RepID=A0A2P2D7T8_9LEPT|nr:hypothetical protein [Leptospira johnsonii]GBF40678.1 hypothetical protein LPTSP1_36960 [Leptospira johnsonii]